VLHDINRQQRYTKDTSNAMKSK